MDNFSISIVVGFCRAIQLDRITCDQYDESYQFGEGQAAHGLVKVPDPDHMKRVQVHRIPDPYMGLLIQKAVHTYNKHSKRVPDYKVHFQMLIKTCYS